MQDSRFSVARVRGEFLGTRSLRAGPFRQTPSTHSSQPCPPAPPPLDSTSFKAAVTLNLMALMSVPASLELKQTLYINLTHDRILKSILSRTMRAYVLGNS